MARNTVSQASIQLADVENAATRKLPERQRRKVAKAKEQMRLREEQRILGEKRDRENAMERARWMQRQIRDANTRAEARLLNDLNPARVVMMSAPLIAPEIFAADLAKLGKVGMAARAMKIPANHPGWTKLESAISRSRRGIAAAQANSVLSLAVPMARAAKTLNDEHASDEAKWNAVFSLGLMASAPPAKVRAAKTRMGGRKWSELPRETKLQIKKDFGVEQFRGHWVSETDPVSLIPGLPPGVYPLNMAVQNPEALAQTGLSGDAVALELFTPGATESQLGLPKTPATEGAAGFSIVIPERAREEANGISGVIAVEDQPAGAHVTTDGLVTHETEHQIVDGVMKVPLEEALDPETLSLYGRYFGKTSEQAAFNSQFRDHRMNEANRANTLLEETVDRAISDYIVGNDGLGARHPEFSDFVRGKKTVGKDRLPDLRGKDGEVSQDAKGGDTRSDAKSGKPSKLSEEQRVARVNAGIAKHPGFSKGDIEDMRRSAAFIADPQNAIRGLLVEGTLKHDAERPVFYSKNGWEDGQEGFQGDRFSVAHTLDDGRVVVIPSIYADEDGATRLHTGRDALEHYERTGEHFGIYDSMENAERASVWSHHVGNAGWLKRLEKQQDAKGGDAGAASGGQVSEPGGGGLVLSPSAGGGPRIVINPSTFRNEKDALCVAFNEAFRLVMEEMGFNPVAEPTEAQRRFFSDTAYRNDELQLRRTILARVCTFDTSVKDPTDEQLQEAVEFLTSVLEAGAPQNEWEQRSVMRLRDVIAQVAEKGRRTGTPTGPSQAPGTSPAGS